MKVFIEQPGEKNKKNVFDKKTGKLLKTVSINVTYPYPYGYILNTVAGDGDNLDCYIITDKKLKTESVVECEPIGMVEWFDDGEEDHKVLAVLQGDSRGISEDVKNRLTNFAQHFFDDQPNKKYMAGKFYAKDAAVELIKKSSDLKSHVAKTNVIIIHGTGGSPKSHWFPWLRTELEKSGYRVFVPKFPTPEGQSLPVWLNVFKDYEQYLDENTILVGHSAGSAFLLSVIEDSPRPIKHAFFISAFLGLLNDPRFDVPNKTFTTRSFNWTRIKNNCRGFTIINSDNDPYVPLERGRTFAENLGAELIVLKNAGHINKDSGYTEFALLLEKIKKLF